MIDFAGWEMPISYPAGTAAEARACRSGAGLFDVSHMGEFRIGGPGALAFLQLLTANDVARLKPGAAQYSLILNEHGGTKDDVIVYRMAEAAFLVVVNAACKLKDWEWFASLSGDFEAALEDVSDETALIAVQGPQAVALISELSHSDLATLKRFHFTKAQVAGIDCTASRTGYTGDDGFELFCAWEDAPALWRAIQGAGAEPCSLSARDVLRIEAAYPLYGHELAEDRSPLLAGLQWAIKTVKPHFIGRESIVQQAQEGLRESLAGLAMTGPANAIAREGYFVYSPKRDEPVGRITSGTLSPTLSKGVALSILGNGFTEPETPLEVDIRGRRVQCEVARLPFYRNNV